MSSKNLVALILSLVMFSLTVILSICGSKSATFAPVEVKVFPTPTSAISPADFSVQVSVYSPSPIENISIFIDDEKNPIFTRKIRPEEKINDTSISENEFSITVTSKGKYVNINFTTRLSFYGDIAKLFSFIVVAETEEKGRGRGKGDVLVYSNQPCSVKIYIASPPGVPVEQPPFPVQLGADVNDDRCGTFNHLVGTQCQFKFIWDADNEGHDFSPDGETDQPVFNFTYQKLGIYTPKVRVIDDGGNTCENQNIEPIYVLKKFENLSFISKESMPSLIEADFIATTTKVIVSKPTYGTIEYDVNEDGKFYLRTITTTIAHDIEIGKNFIMLGSGANVDIIPISGSNINWKESYRITRPSERIDSVSFKNGLTFLIFFWKNNVFFCQYAPPNLYGDVCSVLRIPSDPSGLYGIHADNNRMSIYLAIHRRDNLFNFFLYSIEIKYNNVIRVWEANVKDTKHTEVQLSYLPSKFLFFEDETSKPFLAIPTTDLGGGVGYRTYILDVLSCLSGNCRFVSSSNINMSEVIKDMPDTEICVLTDDIGTYNLNVFDMILGENMSICNPQMICILSTLCLDKIGGLKCKKIAYYPFVFYSEAVNKNFLTTCAVIDFEGRRLLSSRWNNVISYSENLLFSSRLQRGSAKLIDFETIDVEPLGISGFQTDKEIVISVGGGGGIDIMTFSNDGTFLKYDLHITVKPDEHEVKDTDMPLLTDPQYKVTKHFYDEKILIAVIQKGGCGEPYNYSGIFVYDSKDIESMRRRKHRIYKRHNALNIHSLSHLDVKRIDDNRYMLQIIGSRCQDPTHDVIALEIDESGLIERFRTKINRSPVDITVFSDEVVYVSTTTTLMKIENGYVSKEIQVGSGGLLQIYHDYLFMFASQGPYIKAEIYDTELNKIKEQSIYFGIHPLVSKVSIVRAIDEIFGTNNPIDLAILALSAPTPQMRVSAMIVLDVTGFLKSSEDIEILGISPNFGIVTSDVKFFGGGRNLIFFSDPFARGIFIASFR